MRAVAAVAADLTGARHRLEHALVTLESGVDLVFIRAHADDEGPTGYEAREIRSALEGIWERYLRVRSMAERWESAIERGRWEVAEGLLGAALAFPDGTTTTVPVLLVDLQQEVEEVAVRAAALADLVRQAVSRLDRATTLIQELIEQAAALGATDVPELGVARRALTEAMAAVATDPAGHPSPSLDLAIENARDHLDDLQRRREELPERLDESGTRLDRFLGLVERGAAGYDTTRAKVFRPSGLRPPLDASAIEKEVRPWLDRVLELAAAGEWQRAMADLGGWEARVDALAATAADIAEANWAWLAYRDELRGRLEAYRAKAVATGKSEAAVLSRLHEAAVGALYVAPCDLEVAARSVEAYVNAVSHGPTQDAT